jgi:transposase
VDELSRRAGRRVLLPARPERVDERTLGEGAEPDLPGRRSSSVTGIGLPPQWRLPESTRWWWYWAADELAALGANVHLAHPLGVKAFSYRRVKNDVRDVTDLADLLRMGRLPETWIAPPAARELRQLVRHRAKLVHLATSLRCQLHAVLAGQGVIVSVSDLFGLAGTKLLDQLVLPPAYQQRLDSLRRLIDAFDTEIGAVS